jgi:hypothetical protein
MKIRPKLKPLAAKNFLIYKKIGVKINVVAIYDDALAISAIKTLSINLSCFKSNVSTKHKFYYYNKLGSESSA